MQEHFDLARIAKLAMLEKRFAPDFSETALQELDKIKAPATCAAAKDMRHLLWCSIDNDDSRDLDQLTFAEPMRAGATKIYIAIADVAALVKKDTAIDKHAQTNTTSVYTPAKVFTMLPEKLSTNLTSLNDRSDRLAIVVEIVIMPNGAPASSEVYSACVYNQAKLAYNSVAAWLDGEADIPEAVKKVQGMDEQLRFQDKIAENMRSYRHAHGTLTLETIEAAPVVMNNEVVDVKELIKNRAHRIIENFMIAANTATTRFLEEKHYSTLRRVVRVPERWDRIVDLAQELGEKLPHMPDSIALETFLVKRKKADPLRFPDLSLAVIKLLGKGEYVLQLPGEKPFGHFALAIRDYSHSTAPNRRFPDLITQRLIKAALQKEEHPYTTPELLNLAKHCTEKEDDAEKVERHLKKSAAAILLSHKINQRFDAIVTGAGPKGTWVRIFHPPVEGRLVRGFHGVDVGDRISVKLSHLDIPAGYIDFVKN